jgi:hypothetical protein
MLRNLVKLFGMALLPASAVAQGALQGEVTFLTSQHVYVKFSSTEGIAVKDTLDLLKNGATTPCLVVSSMSSTSCVCTVLSGCKLEKQDRIQARTRVAATASTPPPRERRTGAMRTERDTLGARGERIRGRISAASYSNIPSTRDDDHRMMYRFSLTAVNIANSKFSAETYLNYRKLYPANLERYPQRTDLFNVYNLAVSYTPDSNTTLTLGRKINNSASSLGAIDGMQAEHRFGSLFGGVIAGFRPDIYTYGLNTNLLQYGGYVGAQVDSRAISSRSTVGLLQQTNGGMVDRRYAYLQHSSTFKGNLNIFSTAELDLYNAVEGGARLTNLFVSGRYRFGRRVDFFASYDSRRRVVFFETFRNEVEVLLDDDMARQGLRFRLNVRPTKTLAVGATYSRRFQADGANASDNIGLNLNINRDPAGAGQWSVQANRNTSNYLTSDVLSFRHVRALIANRLSTSLYYRILEYRYTSRPEGTLQAGQLSQRYYGADLTLTFARTFTFMILGELSTILDERNYRLNMSLTKRFDSKNKRR